MRSELQETIYTMSFWESFWDRRVVRTGYRLFLSALMVFFAIGWAAKPVSPDAIWVYNVLVAGCYLSFVVSLGLLGISLGLQYIDRD